MAAPRKARRREAQIGFEALSIEGGLLSADWLARVAQLSAGGQTEADYAVLKGLNLRDEIGRYWRIAQAHWTDFASGRTSGADPKVLAERFVLAILRDSFGFASLQPFAPVVIAEWSYPIGFTALGGRVPVVIAPAASELDSLAPAASDGARRRTAFGLTQEFLNAADGAMWGLTTDGMTLRIVRDNASLTRPAWIEADLSRIFTEERYSDFAALWLLAHESRFGRAEQAAQECPLETWRNAGREEGTRAREFLRRGVEDALVALGQGFLGHPSNQSLRAALHNGELTAKEYFNQLLRLVYRIIFLLTVEERGLLHPRDMGEPARKLYEEGYSLKRLRERSAKRSAHDRFSDLWDATLIVFRGVATGEPRLALPALAGIFAKSQCPALDAAKLENRALLLAVFRLSWLREESGLARVNWRDMGPEELGSVYESLLELVPQITQDGRRFTFATGGETKGNARKTTGSYYTHDSLVQELLDSALEPVIAAAIAGHSEKPVEALLQLSIVDSACGSGHFLLAAARRVAAHIARLRSGGTPSPAEYRHALREVIGHCIYGVDLNPMAVELCRVSLWLEAIEPGKPLSFLDHHVRVGNSLLGATPELVAAGLPDDAFTAIEGDDKKFCSGLKKRNKDERGGQRGLLHLMAAEPSTRYDSLAASARGIDEWPDDTIDQIRSKAELFERMVASPEYEHARLVADAWCAAFVWLKHASAPADPLTTDTLRRLESNAGALAESQRAELARVSNQYKFFHWHLAFPDVFKAGGFDCVLGNPPWERLRMEEVQFFSIYATEISEANSSVRTRLIADLKVGSPGLANAWAAYCRETEGTSALVRLSGAFPYTGRSKFNLSGLFTERAAQLVSSSGRVGILVPTALVTDEAGRLLFDDLVRHNRLFSLFDFENSEGLFPSVDGRYRFCLITASGASRVDPGFDAAFGLTNTRALADLNRQVTITAADILAINPNSRTCPVVKDPRDFAVLSHCYRQHGILILAEPRSDPWGAKPTFMFQMTDDEGRFKDLENVEVDGITGEAAFLGEGGRKAKMMRLYEAKLIHQFDHRFATFAGQSKADRETGNAREMLDEEKALPFSFAAPRFWVARTDFEQKIASRPTQGQWLLSYREITNATNARTLIATVIPFVAAGRKIPQLYLTTDAETTSCLLAALNSFALDFIVRSKLSGTSIGNFFLEQLPVPSPAAFDVAFAGTTLKHWIARRVLELTYTAWDLAPFAQDCGTPGPPFRWDENRRFLLRSELDALFFHIYLPGEKGGDWHSASDETSAELGRLKASFPTPRDAVAYILGTFPIIRRKDEETRDGDFRTKRVILEIYDAMQQAIRTGESYQTRLDPAAADPRVAHPIQLALPAMPALEHLHTPEETAARFIWAATYAVPSLSRLELARAWSLRSQPAVLVGLAPDRLRKTAVEWAAAKGGNSSSVPSLLALLNTLESKGAVRFGITGGVATVQHTSETPLKDQVGAWYDFEARLALTVVGTLAPSQFATVDGGLSSADQGLLTATAG